MDNFQLYFNIPRAYELGKTLGKNKEIYFVFMKADPQYLAVQRIIDALGYVEGTLYIIGVSLISYMLSLRGERHWELAATYAEKYGFPLGLVNFAEISPSLKRYRKKRVERIQKYLSKSVYMLENIISKEEIDLLSVTKTLASTLNTSSNAKTVVFAAKMTQYACYYHEKKTINGEKIPIPVDHRVSLVSLTSGLVEGWKDKKYLPRVANILRDKYRGKLQEMWKIVSSTSETSALMIDNVVWVSGRCIEENLLNKPGQIEKCIQALTGCDNECMNIVKEFWKKLL